jgi:hypothetical protein
MNFNNDENTTTTMVENTILQQEKIGTQLQLLFKLSIWSLKSLLIFKLRYWYTP